MTRFTLFLLSAMLGLLGLGSVQAQAPASIAGLSLLGKVAHGVAPFATSGTFRLTASASDNTYGDIGLTGNTGDGYGTYSYTKSSATVGTISYSDTATGLSAVAVLTFTSATAGSFSITAAADPNSSETGTFTVYNGQGPVSAKGWGLVLTVQAGVAPLATKGTAKITAATSGNTYQLVGTGNVASSNGTYTYSLVSSPASSLLLDDSVVGNETATLSWSTGTAGFYIAHDNSGGFQGGTFTAKPPPAPAITSALTAGGTFNTSFTYQITAADNTVVSFGAAGLPAGLSVNTSTGLISGTPVTAGTFKVALSDSNGGATAKATLVLTIAKGTATVALSGLADTYTGKVQPAIATTNPVGLPVTLTYTLNGKTASPLNAGSYAVTATIKSPNATGSTTGTLVISPAAATVTLTPASLNVVYTGLAHAAAATTVPAKIAVTFAYTGTASSTTAPILVGSYPVTATISNPNYTGNTNGTLVIAPVLPLATTGIATTVGAHGATLNSTVNPKGDATTVVYQYGTTTAYGTTTGTQNVAAGTANVAVPVVIGSLLPQTIYHFRVVATNASGPVDGADKTFTTLAVPTIASSPATPLLSASGAQVGFAVTPNGIATSVSFQYGTTTAYGSQTATQAIGTGKTAVNVVGFLPGLLPNTTYHYRVVTVSAAGTFFGPDETFTTLGFDTALVAENGGAAPGIPSVTLNVFDNPTVNEHDAVAYSATLSGTGVTKANDFALFADNNSGTASLIARLGSVAPDTANATYFSMGDPVSNTNAAVAYGASLRVAAGQATTATELGVWSNISGALHLVARQGSAAPGVTNATFGLFDALGLSDSGVVLIASMNINGPAGVNKTNSVGIWEGTTQADLALTLRQADVVGGKTISSFAFVSTQSTVEGQTRAFASDSGDLALAATFTDKTTGIITVIGGTKSLVELSASSVAPGTSGATFATFGDPAINTNDDLAFAGTLTIATGGPTSTTNTGIWADDSTDTLQLIARTGSAAPDTAGTFSSLGDPVYNDNEAVAFAGIYKVGNVLTNGIWCNSTGALHRVVESTDQAPGCPDGAMFSSFSALALPNSGGSTGKGGVIFYGNLTIDSSVGVTAANDAGIWAVDATGTIQLIVRTGDTLLPGKTVIAISFLPPSAQLMSQSRSFAPQDGDLTYLVEFSDKSTAIFNVVFP